MNCSGLLSILHKSAAFPLGFSLGPRKEGLNFMASKGCDAQVPGSGKIPKEFIMMLLKGNRSKSIILCLFLIL